MGSPENGNPIFFYQNTDTCKIFVNYLQDHFPYYQQHKPNKEEFMDVNTMKEEFMSKGTMDIHVKKGTVHIIKALILGFGLMLISRLFDVFGMYVGGILQTLLMTALTWGGLMYCWKDISKGWDKGAMVGLLYGIVFFVLDLVLGKLLHFGFTPFAGIQNIILGAFSGLGGGLGIGYEIWAIILMILNILGLGVFGAVFAWIKDQMNVA